MFEVEGRPVRDRNQRLADLFLRPNADRLAQARRIAAESSRFNLNLGRYEIHRTINMPLTALGFLRAGLAERFTVRSIINVSYGEEPRLKLWVPVWMEERYNLSGGVLLSGSATYSNFRRFSVDTSTTIKVP